MMTTTMPEAARVGQRAAQIMDAMRAHPGYQRLRSSSMKYSTCWATFTGYPLMAEHYDSWQALTEAAVPPGLPGAAEPEQEPTLW